MLTFTVFELLSILSNLSITDTIFGSVPVRDELMEKIRVFLDENGLLDADAIVYVEVK